MIDYSNTTVTHPLYNHFLNWAGLDINNEENYSMINQSLYATETYISNRFGVNISPVNVRESHDRDDSVARFSYNTSNVLSVLKDNSLVLPAVNYFSDTDGKYVDVIGTYTDEGNSLTFNETMLNTYINYLSGYIVKDILEYEEDVNASLTSAPKLPYIEYNGIKLMSPMTIPDATVSVTLSVYGEEGATVILDDTATASVIDATGKVDIVITTSKKFNVHKIALQDTDGNTSNGKKFIIIKSTSIDKTTGTLISHDLVTGGSNISATIYLDGNAELELPDDLVPVSLGKGLHTLSLNCPTTEGEKYLKIKIKNADATYSSPIIIPVIYNSTLDASYIDSINIARNKKPYIPNDLLVAFFRLADHFYRGTLFKNDNISRQSAGVSKSVTFSSHSIPKEIVSTIHMYSSY